MLNVKRTKDDLVSGCDRKCTNGYQLKLHE